jgi:hypothetical protein
MFPGGGGSRRSAQRGKRDGGGEPEQRADQHDRLHRLAHSGSGAKRDAGRNDDEGEGEHSQKQEKGFHGVNGWSWTSLEDTREGAQCEAEEEKHHDEKGEDGGHDAADPAGLSQALPFGIHPSTPDFVQVAIAHKPGGDAERKTEDETEDPEHEDEYTAVRS